MIQYSCRAANFFQVMKLLAVHEDLTDQIDTLIKAVEMSTNDIQERINICQHIQKTFAKAFNQPGLCVYPFGSSKTGLGFKGCDLDVYVEMGIY